MLLMSWLLKANKNFYSTKYYDRRARTILESCYKNGLVELGQQYCKTLRKVEKSFGRNSDNYSVSQKMGYAASKLNAIEKKIFTLRANRVNCANRVNHQN